MLSESTPTTTRPQSSGKLIDALADAPVRKWTVVDMAKDWREVWTKAETPEADYPNGRILGKWLAEDIMGGGVLDSAQSTLEI